MNLSKGGGGNWRFDPQPREIEHVCHRLPQLFQETQRFKKKKILFFCEFLEDLVEISYTEHKFVEKRDVYE